MFRNRVFYCLVIFLASLVIRADANGKTFANPATPFRTELEGMSAGETVTVTGTPKGGCKKFTIDFIDRRDGHLYAPFHFNARMTRKELMRDALTKGGWQGGNTTLDFPFPFKCNKEFNLVFLCKEDGFEVTLNGENTIEFKHITPPETINGLHIFGDISLKEVEVPSNVEPTTEKIATTTASPPITTSPTSDNCWKSSENMILVGHVQGVVDASDIDECQAKCDNHQEFFCQSVMFYPADPESNCLLNSETSKTAPEEFAPEDEGIEMIYSEKCSESPEADMDLVPWYQLYNEERHDHFYTIDPAHRQRLLTRPNETYVDQGIAAYMLSSNDTKCPEKIPVYTNFLDQRNNLFTTNRTDPRVNLNVDTHTYCLRNEGECGANTPIRHYQSTIDGKTNDYYVAAEKLDDPNYEYIDIMCYAWPVPESQTSTTETSTGTTTMESTTVSDWTTIRPTHTTTQETTTLPPTTITTTEPTTITTTEPTTITTTEPTTITTTEPTTITTTEPTTITTTEPTTPTMPTTIATTTIPAKPKLEPWYQLYFADRNFHAYTTNPLVKKAFIEQGMEDQGIANYMLSADDTSCKEKIPVINVEQTFNGMTTLLYTTNPNAPKKSFGHDIHTYCVKNMGECGATLPIRRYHYFDGVRDDNMYVAGKEMNKPGYRFMYIMCYAWPIPRTAS